MTASPSLSHSVTALVEASAQTVFEFLADPLAVGKWALASSQAEPTDRPGIYTGRSLFDATQNWFALTAYPQLLLVEYSVGPQNALLPRIHARVIRPEAVGIAATSCYLTLTAWRPVPMADSRWSRLCASHDIEIWLIKEQIEAANASSPGYPA